MSVLPGIFADCLSMHFSSVFYFSGNSPQITSEIFSENPQKILFMEVSHKFLNIFFLGIVPKVSREIFECFFPESFQEIHLKNFFQKLHWYFFRFCPRDLLKWLSYISTKILLEISSGIPSGVLAEVPAGTPEIPLKRYFYGLLQGFASKVLS